MKKGLAVILAVAIIGLLGIYTIDHKNSSASMTTSGTHSSQSSSSASAGNYTDGNYKGQAEDTPYGPVQIAVAVSGGKITEVSFLQMPNDRGRSSQITASSEPLLKQTTLDKQSAHIDFVTGATATSDGYQQSLQSALDQAA